MIRPLERDIVAFISKELEKDERLLQQIMNQYPVVGNAINKLRVENSELKARIEKLENEILRIQHEGVSFHDLGQ